MASLDARALRAPGAQFAEQVFRALRAPESPVSEQAFPASLLAEMVFLVWLLAVQAFHVREQRAVRVSVQRRVFQADRVSRARPISRACRLVLAAPALRVEQVYPAHPARVRRLPDQVRPIDPVSISRSSADYSR